MYYICNVVFVIYVMYISLYKICEELPGVF